jgi:hypothetical protein
MSIVPSEGHACEISKIPDMPAWGLAILSNQWTVHVRESGKEYFRQCVHPTAVLYT